MKKTSLTITALCLALGAQAQTSASITVQLHSYGLLSLGQGHLNADCSGAQACDRNATGGKAVVGYAFGNGFAVEGAYSHFGKFRASDATVGLSARPEAASLSGAFTANLTPDLGLVGRAGIARVRTKLHAEVGTLTGSGSESHTQPIVGLALNYAITPMARVELGLDATRAEVQAERANVRLVTIGARMAF